MDRELFLNLRAAGLTAPQARVYATTLELGGGLVSEIARRASVPRTNCYHILKTLGEKGLVSTSSKGRSKYYLAENPRRLVVEQRKKLSLVEGMVPSLLALEKTARGAAPKMRYYEGFEGIVSVFNESLNAKSEILTYSNIEKLIKKFPGVLREHCRERARRKQRIRTISSYHPDAEHFLTDFYPSDYIQSSVQLLFVNPREFLIESEVTIFDDKVCVISLSEQENLGVIIENQGYADTTRTIFNLSWLGATSFVAR